MYYRKITFFIISLLICNQASPSGMEEIYISNARIIESPPVVGMNAGYLEIENTYPHPIILNEVTSDEFKRIEIHQSVIEGGIARMKKTGPVTIPAHSQWIFKPGDYHLMLFQPARILKAGDTVNLKFQFSDGSTIDSIATVIHMTSR